MTVDRKRLVTEGPTVVGMLTTSLESGGSLDTAVRSIAREGPPLTSGIFEEVVRLADTRGCSGVREGLSEAVGRLPSSVSGYKHALLLCITASESEGTESPGGGLGHSPGFGQGHGGVVQQLADRPVHDYLRTRDNAPDGPDVPPPHAGDRRCLRNGRHRRPPGVPGDARDYTIHHTGTGARDPQEEPVPGRVLEGGGGPDGCASPPRGTPGDAAAMDGQRAGCRPPPFRGTGGGRHDRD